ncbi:MAG: hypothetical protein LBQ22_13145 [Bacteroidales bacterium]|jgi:hypothetical protein|nr:hypothetical protein [Bacteroidales bacterium]
MKDKILSVTGGIFSGVITYAENSWDFIFMEIGVPLIIAFGAGILGYFGNTIGKIIFQKIKNRCRRIKSK